MLLKAKADINQRNKRGHTPLFVAVNGSHFFAVQFLIKEGADPNIAASDTRTALFAAAANANPSSLPIFNCLLETARSKEAVKEMVSIRTKDGRAILHSACASSNVDVVKRLLEAGAAVNVQSDDGATPLARVHLSSMLLLPLTVYSIAFKHYRYMGGMQSSKHIVLSHCVERLGRPQPYSYSVFTHAAMQDHHKS